MSGQSTATKPNVEITNHMLAQLTEKSIIYGSRYVFLNAGTLVNEESALGKMLRSMGILVAGSPEPQIAGLVGQTELEVAGCAKISGRVIDAAPIGAIYTDRPIYKAGRDRATLLVAVLNRPNETVKLHVKFGKSRIRTLSVELDHFGTGTAELRVDRIGVHTVSLEGAEDITCSFQGSDYRRPALEASIRDHKLDFTSDTLTARFRVTSYGRPLPVGTELLLQLREKGVRRGNKTVLVDGESEVSAEWNLNDSKDDLTVFIQVKASPAKTAEVAIHGARESERRLFTLNHLGDEYGLSLLSHDDALDVRAMHISQTGIVHNTPFSVDSALAHDLRLIANVACALVRIDTINPFTGGISYSEFRDVRPGDVLVADVTAPWNVFTIGALIRQDEGDGLTPWEAGTIIVKPVDLGVYLSADSVKPGERAKIHIRTTAPTSVLLVVRMAQFAGENGQSLLARSQKGRMESLADLLAVNEPTDSVGAAAEEYDPYGGRYYEAAVLGSPRGGPLRTLGLLSADEGFPEAMAFTASIAASVPKGVLVEEGGAQTAVRTKLQLLTEVITARELTLETAFAGVVQVDGHVDLEVYVGEDIAEMVVDALAVGSLCDTASASTTFSVTKPTSVDIKAPPSIVEGTAPVRLMIQAESKLVQIIARTGNQLLPVWIDGSEFAPDDVADAPCEALVYAPAGELSVQVIDPIFGETDMQTVTIATTGKSEIPIQRIAIVPVGGRINAEELGCIDLRVAPGLDKAFKRMTLALGSYQHKCCEQTAAVMMAALVMAMQGDGGGKDHFLAGVSREQSMWAGNGFRMYPEGTYGVNDHYSKIASRRLARMGASAGHPALDHDMNRGITEAETLGLKGCSAHNISVVPAQIENMRDAFFVYTSMPDRRGEAMRFVRSNISDAGNGRMVAAPSSTKDWDDDPVQVREQTAFASATCAADGDLITALALANSVVDQLDEKGGLFSTLDMVAALQMMQQLMELGLVSDGSSSQTVVRLNGLEMSLAEALGYSGDAAVIEAVDGPVAVQYTVMQTVDWNSYQPNMKLSAQIRRNLTLGQDTDLVVTLTDGYKAGDFVQIALPYALVSPAEGVQRTLLEVDFEGNDKVTIPVLAIERSISDMGLEPQDVEVVVLGRNMFKEKSIGLVRARVKVA